MTCAYLAAHARNVCPSFVQFCQFIAAIARAEVVRQAHKMKKPSTKIDFMGQTVSTDRLSIHPEKGQALHAQLWRSSGLLPRSVLSAVIARNLWLLALLHSITCKYSGNNHGTE